MVNTKLRRTNVIVVTMPIGCGEFAGSVFKIRNRRLIRVYSTARADRDRAGCAALEGYRKTVKPTIFDEERIDLQEFFRDEVAAVARIVGHCM